MSYSCEMYDDTRVDYQVKHCHYNLVYYIFNSVAILLMEHKACFYKMQTSHRSNSYVHAYK